MGFRTLHGLWGKILQRKGKENQFGGVIEEVCPVGERNSLIEQGFKTLIENIDKPSIAKTPKNSTSKMNINPFFFFFFFFFFKAFRCICGGSKVTCVKWQMWGSSIWGGRGKN
jgi:hypothetical protein